MRAARVRRARARDLRSLPRQRAPRSRARCSFPAYRAMDGEPPRLVDGRVRVHPRMREIYPAAGRARRDHRDAAGRGRRAAAAASPSPALASAYLMAANLSARRLRRAHRRRGAPHRGVRRRGAAASASWRACTPASGPARWRSPSRRPARSLADVKTRATPTRRRATTSSRGSKIFISGGDHDLTENIVHMTLARIDGAPRRHQGRLALLRAQAARSRRRRRARRQRRARRRR